MKQSFYTILLLALVSCNNSQNEAPAFSLEDITSEQLPAYNIISTNTGDMGQSYYTLEWQSPLSEQDSLSLKHLLSDFYEGADNNYFKCYAQGDSSVCFHLNDKGLIVTKEQTIMFKPIIEKVFKDADVTIPDNIKPAYYSAFYGFIDSSYSIGFYKSYLPEKDVRELYLWSKSLSEGNTFDADSNADVCIIVDSIADKPIMIIRYDEH